MAEVEVEDVVSQLGHGPSRVLGLEGPLRDLVVPIVALAQVRALPIEGPAERQRLQLGTAEDVRLAGQERCADLAFPRPAHCYEVIAIAP